MIEGSKNRMKNVLIAGALVIGLGIAAVIGLNRWTMSHKTADTPGNTTAADSMKHAPEQAPVPMKFVRNGQNVKIDMYAENTTVPVGNGDTFHAWTFDGTLPGPVLYLQQGDHVTLTLHNLDPTMPHSIDLHAAQVAPNTNFVDVDPGKSKSFTFDADLPGVYMYHCATQPMLMHIGMGMYGAVVISPKGQSKPMYTIVQSEIYRNGNFQDMSDEKPEYVVFNGKANQYMEHPLTAKVGQSVSVAFVNAGPNRFSAFHVVGTLIRDARASGNPDNHLYNIQTYTVAPGDGALFELTFHEPGTYMFLTHAANDASKGAMGSIVVTP